MTRVIAVLAFDGVKLLDVAGPVEVFAEANRYGADYDVRVVSVDGRDVTSSAGVVLRAHSDVAHRAAHSRSTLRWSRGLMS